MFPSGMRRIAVLISARAPAQVFAAVPLQVLAARGIMVVMLRDRVAAQGLVAQVARSETPCPQQQILRRPG